MLASLHPIIVHFAIVLAVTGIVLRWVSLTRWVAFSSPAARTLIVAASLAGLLAVVSGNQAHGPVERVPGSRAAVQEHEEAGEWARNLIVVLALIELLGPLAARAVKPRHDEIRRWVHLVSSGVGVLGLGVVLRAGALGGELVYSYAGGVGIRSGDSADVGRLLLAGLYHQIQLDRKAQHPEEAALLAELALRRFPMDLEVRILAADSLRVDRKDPAAAITALKAIEIPKDQARLRVTHAMATADALDAAGQPDGARALLQALAVEYPDDRRLARRLSGPPPPGR